MANNDFDKRMEFLEKSYDRLPSSFNPDEVLQKIEEGTNKSGKNESTSKKKGTFRRAITVWTVGIASVFLFGIITALYITEDNEKLATAKYIQDYAVEREKQRDALHLEEGKFGKMSFVQKADEIMDNIADEKEQVKVNYERALASLRLPSDMMKDIAHQSLIEDEQASYEYLDSFFGKIRDLITVYDEILAENHQAIEDFEVDPSIDKAAEMMLSTDTFPAELQNVINTMSNQYIELTIDKDTGEIKTHYYAPQLADEVKSHFHRATLGYVTWAFTRVGQLEEADVDGRAEIANQTITLPDRLFEQQVKSLYEQFKNSHDKTIFKGLSLVYIVGVFNYANDMEDPETMYYLSQGNDVSYGFDDEGEDYKLEWYILNWRKGESLFDGAAQIVFSADSVRQFDSALDATVQIISRDGSSKDIYFDWGSSQVWQLFMQGLDSDLTTYSLPQKAIDEKFMAKVHHEYKMYTESNYQNDLPGVDPMTIVGLYFYAAEIGDYETVYSLYVQGEFGPFVDKETFMKEAALSPTVKFDEVYQSISFKADEQTGGNGNWGGLATLTLNPEHDPNDSKTHYFSMSQSDRGWRVNYLPMQ